MNLIELERALRQLRLGGVAAVLETRLRQAQAEAMAPIDLISCLVSDELSRRSERLLERRRKQAAFRDLHRTLDNFDFTFNPKINRSLVFDLATCAFIGKREEPFLPGTGKVTWAKSSGKLPSTELPGDVPGNACPARSSGRGRRGRYAQAVHGGGGQHVAPHH
jgi:DNA replication protein DnaC